MVVNGEHDGAALHGATRACRALATVVMAREAGPWAGPEGCAGRGVRGETCVARELLAIYLVFMVVEDAESFLRAMLVPLSEARKAISQMLSDCRQEIRLSDGL